MTSNQPQARPKPIQSRPRRVNLLLRDGGVVEGGLYLNDGQALAPYLGSRKGGWVNVVRAIWLGEGEVHNHAVIQSDHLVFGSSPDGDFPIQATILGSVPRAVDILLEDGSRLRGDLHLGDKQRLSDFLYACGKFMPLLGAVRVPANEEIGDVALNCGCIKAVRDAKVFEPGSMVSEADAQSAWGGLRRTTAPAGQPPVNLEMVKSVVGAMEVVTPGRIPDRRIGQLPSRSPTPARPALVVEKEAAPSAATAACATAVGRHWLVLLGAGAKLLPPDPALLSDAPQLEEIWRGICARNDMAEGELAVHVAAAFHRDIANLDEATAEAVRIVPEKVARRLGVLPLTVDNGTLTAAVSDPQSHEIEQQVGFLTKLKLRFLVAPPADIRGAIDWHYREPAR